MSYFYGTMNGGRRDKTVRGHRTSGLTTTARSYYGDIRTELVYDSRIDRPRFYVTIIDHDTGAIIKCLGEGVLEGCNNELG